MDNDEAEEADSARRPSDDMASGVRACPASTAKVAAPSVRCCFSGEHAIPPCTCVQTKGVTVLADKKHTVLYILLSFSFSSFATSAALVKLEGQAENYKNLQNIKSYYTKQGHGLSDAVQLCVCI
jgi:hypothetical protein